MTKMVVMKPFMSDEGLLNTGTVIDGSQYRNTKNLISARYLRPFDEMTPEAPAPGSKDPVAPVAAATEEVVVEKPKRRTRKKNETE